MGKKTPAGKEPSVREIADAANTLAQGAFGTATVSGVLVQAILNSLLENGQLSQGDVQKMYENAYASVRGVDMSEAARSTAMHQLILEILRRTAAGHKVRLKG